VPLDVGLVILGISRLVFIEEALATRINSSGMDRINRARLREQN